MAVLKVSFGVYSSKYLAEQMDSRSADMRSLGFRAETASGHASVAKYSQPDASHEVLQCYFALYVCRKHEMRDYMPH